ncbi:MAG: FxsA family protein [Bacteroidota bacterium]
MLARLLLLFLITPVVELALLLQVGEWIGFWPTVALILVTGITGSYLARREGLSVWKKLNDRLAQGGLPSDELTDGVIVLMSGALLITPGVLTDVVGFSGLLPPTRALIRKAVLKRVRASATQGTFHTYMGGFGEPFDAYPPGGAPYGPEADYSTPSWDGDAHETPGYADPNRPA